MTVKLEAPGAAQSDLLIHFCGRGENPRFTAEVPVEICYTTPENRLERILAEERFLGVPPFGCSSLHPAVCFSESPITHLTGLIQDRGWLPWGVVVRRSWLYAVGGGPVWYARNEQYRQLTLDQQPWAVRFDADTPKPSDWLHERVWRVVLGPEDPQLRFSPADIVAVLVGSPAWTPAKVLASPTTCDLYGLAYGEMTELPDAWQSAEKWIWDQTRNQVVHPDGTAVTDLPRILY